MSDEDVLRIAHQSGHAADVGAGRERDEIRRDEHHAEQQHERVVLTARYARSGVITPVAIINTAPSNAAAGRFSGKIFNCRPLIKT